MIARASEESTTPRCSTAVRHDFSSRRTFANVRSSSLSSSKAGCLTPTRAGTFVLAPTTSSSKRSRLVSCPATRSYRPMAMRCERKVGGSPAGALGGSWVMVKSEYVPSEASSNCGRIKLTPLVRSHSSVQPERSRPEVASSSLSRSDNCVLPQACLTK